jgi:predicted choloylglycine hydrolase
MQEAPDYRTFDLHGSHTLVGFELGRADPPFRMQPWWFPPPPEPFAQACADVVRELHPHVLDEFHAYADAQQLDAAALWRQCCRVNLKARIQAQVSAEGCSTFAWFAPHGQVLVGRNYDYWPMQARRQRIRFRPDCCALPTIGARGGVPCGRYDGMNAHGVFVSLHVVMTDTPLMDEVSPGVPFHLVGRIALELCHSAREARDLLLRMPHISSLNYLVADAQEAFVIEADPRGVRVLERAGAVLAATNHFRHPDTRRFQGRRASVNSECRLDFLLAAGRANDGSVDALLDHAERVMADKTAPLCGASGALTTLWSCVAELRSRRIRYAPGAPDVTPFTEPTWAPAD